MLKIPGKPYTISPDTKEIFAVTIGDGEFASILEDGCLAMNQENYSMWNLVGALAEAKYRRHLKDDSPEVAETARTMFSASSYAAYLAFSLEVQGSLPSIPPANIQQSLSTKKECRPGHEWHFALDEDEGLQALANLLESADKHILSALGRNSLRSGLGLVGYLLNDGIIQTN